MVVPVHLLGGALSRSHAQSLSQSHAQSMATATPKIDQYIQCYAASSRWRFH